MTTHSTSADLSSLVSSSQVYYKVIKDIEPGEELLVHVKEGAYSLGAVPPSLDGKTPQQPGNPTPVQVGQGVSLLLVMWQDHSLSFCRPQASRQSTF
jgi:hypothetical protein